MRPLRSLAGLTLVFSLLLPTATGLARHGAEYLDGEDKVRCKKYSTEDFFHSNLQSGFDAAVLAAEFAYDIVDKVVDEPTGKGIAGGVLAAVKAAALVVSGIDRVAQACVEGRHWQLEDDLMRATIQADLAVTTTPNAGFVMPERSERGHIDVRDEQRAGFIDRLRDGEDDLAAGMTGSATDLSLVGVRTAVAQTITAMKDAGQCSCSTAIAYYNHAVSKLGAGAYKQAYTYFRQAYVYAFSN